MTVWGAVLIVSSDLATEGSDLSQTAHQDVLTSPKAESERMGGKFNITWELLSSQEVKSYLSISEQFPAPSLAPSARAGWKWLSLPPDEPSNRELREKYRQ